MRAPRRKSSRGVPDRSEPAYPPSADRTTVEEIGTVKWYNANKGFGFIAPDRGGKDIFVHASVLERSGIMGLAEAQRVAGDVADGQKAVAAQLLGDRLHPRFREGRLLRVETPCTYISASAATSARSERCIVRIARSRTARRGPVAPAAPACRPA